jgi:DNA-directed RNA polymerase subunit E"
VTTDWQGFVVIMNPERSEVAKRLNVTDAGNYALKVNIR